MKTDKKFKIAVIFGGESPEHEISLLSAKNVINLINPDKYDVILIGITKQGEWGLYQKDQAFKHIESADTITLGKPDSHLAILPGKNGGIISLTTQKIIKLDLVLPIIHGVTCEDGALQGTLELAGIPFASCNILGASIGMDKEIMKKLLLHEGLNVAKFLIFYKHQKTQIIFTEISKKLGLPFFVKPVNTGSSIGISKIENETEFHKAINLAFKYDSRIIIEQNIKGREIECAIIGNENPSASLIGEIIPHDTFYSYKAKYLDPKGAILKYPLNFPEKLNKKIQNTAIKAYKALYAKDFARVDMFLTENEEIYINEINTIPGFTNISMFPKLWEASGVSQPELVEKIILMGMEGSRHLINYSFPEV